MNINEYRKLYPNMIFTQVVPHQEQKLEELESKIPVLRTELRTSTGNLIIGVDSQYIKQLKNEQDREKT